MKEIDKIVFIYLNNGKILSILLLITCMIAGVVFYATFISVKNVNIVNTTITSSKIPDEMWDY